MLNREDPSTEPIRQTLGAHEQMTPNQDQPPSLQELTQESNAVLMRTSTVFPFTIFPDEMVISVNRIDIVHRPFFFSKQVFPVFIKDLQNATVSTNLLFGELKLEIKFKEQNPPPLRFLPKPDALKARRIIMGLLAAYKEGIDVTLYDSDTVLRKVEQIGQSQVASIPE